MKGSRFIVFIITSVILSWNSQGLSLEKDTHKAINEKVAQTTINNFSLNSYLINNLGIVKGVQESLNGVDADSRNVRKTIFQWLGYGGEQEDRPGSNWDYILRKPTRSVNHFHNPLKTNWNEAGLNDELPLIGSYTGLSSVLWAQISNQNPGGTWSWQDAREYFYLALTASDKTTQEENYANTFRAVGQLMHLVEDASVPQHARNDIHILPAYEKAVENMRLSNITQWNDWMNNPKSFDKSILTIASNHGEPIPSLSRIIDTDRYDSANPNITTQANCSLTKSITCNTDSNCPTGEICVSTIGISEYTNANFLSEDTMFTDGIVQSNPHYFSYPSMAAAILWTDITNKRQYLKKTGDGEPVEHLAAVSFLYRYRQIYFPQYTEKLPVGLDEECYKEYASKLIPRAVGYSAGLLDYFFRGNIEITLTDGGIYAQTDNPAGFTNIKLLAKNTTSTGEEMTDGSIELVVKYKLALEDPFQSVPVPTAEDFSYIVVPEMNNTRSIPKDSPVELTFDLTQNPVPLWAIDVYLQVVYKGRLGNEDGAIVVGFKDISEPTPVDILNDMDRICLNGNFYVAGSPEAIAQVDAPENGGNDNGIADEWDVYGHDIKDIYIRFSPASDPKYASPSKYNFFVPYLSAGDFLRALYILSDYKYKKNLYQSWIRKDPQDPWGHLSWTTVIYSDTAIKNQTDYVEDVAICGSFGTPCYIWWYSTFLEYRNYEIWWGGGNMYINNAYPAGSECTCYEGITRTCPVQVLTTSSTKILSPEGALIQQGIIRMQSPSESEGGISGIMPLVSP